MGDPIFEYGYDVTTYPIPHIPRRDSNNLCHQKNQTISLSKDTNCSLELDSR